MSNPNPSNSQPGAPQEPPILMRMMHPSSGRENFGNIIQTPLSPPVPVSPVVPSNAVLTPTRYPQLNIRTQQAISTSNVPYPGMYPSYLGLPNYSPSWNVYNDSFWQYPPYPYHYPYQR